MLPEGKSAGRSSAIATGTAVPSFGHDADALSVTDNNERQALEEQVLKDLLGADQASKLKQSTPHSHEPSD